MSTRSLASRLAKLGAPPQKAARCTHHGDVCQMGAAWPQVDPMADLRAMLLKPGQVDPYTIHEHVAMTPAEVRRDDREHAELLASLRARNARIEARMAAGDLDYWEPA